MLRRSYRQGTATGTSTSSGETRFMAFQGRGYDGYSMSNNARDAYERGEMPKSKWTTKEILDNIAVIDPEKAELLKGVKLPVLRMYALENTGWHHTSSMYNVTDFYGISEDFVENLTPERAAELKAMDVDEKQEAKFYRGDFDYIEWTGSRQHPKANPVHLKNVTIEERGSTYYVRDDSGKLLVKKRIGSNGTSVVNYEERAAQKRAGIEYDRQRFDSSSKEALDFLGAKFSEEDGFTYNYGDFERSSSGNIYKLGRKPSRADYENGLEKFFKDGEIRANVNERGGYDVERWNGKEWEKTGNNDVRFMALPDDRANFKSALRQFKNGTLNKRIPVTVTSETPSVLLSLDLSDLGIAVRNRKITIPYSVIEKAIGEKPSTSTGEGHNLDLDTLENLPDSIYAPVMVLDSNTENCLEIYTQLFDLNGKPVMVALALENKENIPGKRPREYVVNSIRSVYGKDNVNTIINRLRSGHGRYVNIKLADIWSRAAGVQFPGAGEINTCSAHIIIDSGDNASPESGKNEKIRFSLAERSNEELGNELARFCLPLVEKRLDNQSIRDVVETALLEQEEKADKKAPYPPARILPKHSEK